MLRMKESVGSSAFYIQRCHGPGKSDVHYARTILGLYVLAAHWSGGAVSTCKTSQVSTSRPLSLRLLGHQIRHTPITSTFTVQYSRATAAHAADADRYISAAAVTFTATRRIFQCRDGGQAHHLPSRYSSTSSRQCCDLVRRRLNLFEDILVP